MKKLLAFLLAIVMLVSLSVSVFAGSEEAEVTVDGVITVEEWGNPVFSGDHNTNWSKAPLWDYWQFNPAPADQTYDVYVKKGAEKIYVGVRLNNASDLDTTCTSIGDLWTHAQLSFTLSKYVASTTVPKVEINGEQREQYSYWRMGLLNGTDKANYCAPQGVEPYTLQDADYEIVYDTAANSYTYEVAIPYSATNITPDDTAVVLSLDMNDSLLAAGANRYHCSYAASQAESDGAITAAESGHAGTSPIIAYVEENYIGTSVAQKKGDITIDGSVSEEEWGKPVVVTNPYHTRSDIPNGLYWEIDGVVKGLQTAKMYFTNDTENVYVALTLDNAQDNGIECTEPGALWNSAHFGFNIAPYVEASGVPQFEYEGLIHEIFTGFWLGEVNGVKGQTPVSHGMTAVGLPEENYEVKFDDATSTWIYEVKIPLSMTTIDLSQHTEMVFSASIGDGNVGAGANRYLITQGFLNTTSADGYCVCENGMYEGGFLKFALNGLPEEPEVPDEPVIPPVDQNYVSSAATANLGDIQLDGSVSEEEWGKPVMVTDPLFTRSDIENGLYWEMDGIVKEDQSAKFYLTNDDENIYLALTLDHALDNTEECTDPGMLWNFAHFGFNIAQYNQETGVEQIDFEDQKHEVYTGFWLGEVNGVKGQAPVTHGMTAQDLPEENYEVKYDEETATWTYEVKIPISMTNINLAESREIVFSASIGDGNVGAGANRYLITQGFLNSTIADNEYCFCEKGMYEGGFLRFTLNELTELPEEPETPEEPEDETENYVSSNASAIPESIKVDGTVSEEEWGKPVMVTDPLFTRNEIENGLYWEMDGVVKENQTAKLYLTNDKENIYLALTLDKSAYDDSCTDPGMLWNAAHFGFTIGQYNEDTLMNQIDFEEKKHEAYTGFWLGIVNGEKGQCVITHGMTAQDLPEENYEVKFDEETATWTYEVKLPISMTNIDLSQSRDIAFSASIGDANQGAGANRYLITQGLLNATSNNEEYCTCEIGHEEGGVLKFTLNETAKKIDTFVLDKAPSITKPVKIDGVITDKEWGGTPVVQTTPTHCQNTWGNFWSFDPSSVNNEQIARLYLTNDSEYLYIGATINECDYDDTCTDPSLLYKSAHFNFSISGYDEETTVKRIEFEGDMYEQYTGFMMGLVNGKPGSYTFTQGHTAWELPADDYMITYDEETRTYTYEVRIPFSLMNVTSDKVAISASIGSSYTGGDAANRYNLTIGSATCGGANNWAHLNNAMVFTLSTIPNTGDMDVLTVVAIVAVSALGVVVTLKAKKKYSSK